MLADTHLTTGRGAVLVDLLRQQLAAAEMIIHAGDVVAGDVLDLLAQYAPLVAVQGNNDTGLDLPTTVQVEFAGHQIAVVHDSGAAKGRPARLCALFPSAAVVVFGHSHLPWNETVDTGGGVQHHFNPGSPTQRRRAPRRSVGWIDLDDTGISCRHEFL